MINNLISIIKNFWPMLLVFLIVMIIIVFFKFRNSKAEFVFHKEFFYILFILYTLLLYDLVKCSLIKGDTINLVPFRDIIKSSLTLKSFFDKTLLSFLIFIPFGYYSTFYCKIKTVKENLFIGLVSSLTILLVILKIYGIFNIDNLIMNVLGTFVGFLLYVGLAAIRKHLPNFFQKDIFYNFICLLIIIGIVLYFCKINGLGW